MGWQPPPPPKNATPEQKAEYRAMLVTNLRRSWLGRRALKRLERPKGVS